MDKIKNIDKEPLHLTHPQLIREWCPILNKNLMPQEVSAGSHRKVWWICSNGHSWESSINTRTSGSGCPICANHELLMGYNDLATTHPELAQEWNYDKNGSFTPQEVLAGSNQKVWWTCSKGHDFESSIVKRTNGVGCPICASRKLLVGYNDLKTTHPELAKEWCYDLNGNLTPQDVFAGGHQKVWWQCSKGHTWPAEISNRTNGKGCPYCSNSQVLAGYNDLETIHPKLAAEWNVDKNGGLTPQDVLAGSNQKVWWICSKGHEFEAQISNRVRGGGCPYCSNSKVLVGFNDFATTHPELVKEWDDAANGDLTPQDFLAGSDKKVAWKCEKGHHWVASLKSRTSGKSGCPICANRQVLVGYNDLGTTHPELCKEWDYDKNENLTPQDIFAGNKKKVWWTCAKGHSYEASPNHRTSTHRKSGTGCPICANKKILVGCNDLGTTNPELAAEWDHVANGDLTPQKVSEGSSKEVGWICSCCGETWRAKIIKRSYGYNPCPNCRNKLKSNKKREITN